MVTVTSTMKRMRASTSSPSLPEVLELCSVSSDSTDASETLLSTSSYPTKLDTYSDVRDRMEALSARDRAHFAFRTDRLTKPLSHHEEEDTLTGISWFASYTTYLSYVLILLCGYTRSFCSRVFLRGRYTRRATDFQSDDLSKFAPLLKPIETFYTRRIYHRIQDCFNRPVASRPAARIDILERVSADGNKTMDMLGKPDSFTGTSQQWERYAFSKHYTVSNTRVARKCLNLGSYNYLGFADDWDITCRSSVMDSLEEFPVSTSSSRVEYGTTSLHRQVEETVASFVGKEDAIALNMGFNTNATTIPALTNQGDLIVSDQLNHTSIVNGARASGASIRTFRHNDIQQLEDILKEAIVLGQPRTRRPWNKILIIVEGIYSMEGEYCDLRNVVRLAKQYGAYTYLDEAHSIGAMGPTGRGCAEYTGVDPADIDIMMGTFTKSFGGMGGYIAADKDVIAFLRRECAGSACHSSLSPVVCQQIISSFKVIMGEDGSDIGKQKLRALRDNSNYFRMRLADMGMHLLGHYDSPIIPLMLYSPPMIAAFSRECLKRGLAVVVVGFPAVPVLACRARFCVSAGHTREDLDFALEQLSEIADLLKIRYGRSIFG